MCQIEFLRNNLFEILEKNDPSNSRFDYDDAWWRLLCHSLVPDITNSISDIRETEPSDNDSYSKLCRPRRRREREKETSYFECKPCLARLCEGVLWFGMRGPVLFDSGSLMLRWYGAGNEILIRSIQDRSPSFYRALNYSANLPRYRTSRQGEDGA